MRKSTNRSLKGGYAEGNEEIRVSEVEEVLRGEAKRAEICLTLCVSRGGRDERRWLNEVEDVSNEFGREEIEVTGGAGRVRGRRT